MSSRGPVRTGSGGPLAWLVELLVFDLSAGIWWKALVAGVAVLGVSAAIIAPRFRATPVSLPAPQGFVTDVAGVVGAEERGRLEAICRELERGTGIELAVATVPSLGGLTIEEYANRLFNEWGVGKKGKNNGVLILVAPGARKVRIEVGYGLEPVLPDGLCGEIIRRDGLPEFREARYAAGIEAMARRVSAAAGGRPETSAPAPGKPGSTPGQRTTVRITLTVLMSMMAALMTWMAGGGLANRLFLPPIFYSAISLSFVFPALEDVGPDAAGLLRVLVVATAVVGGFVAGIRTGRADPRFLRETGSLSGWAAGWGACGFGGGGGGGFGGGSSGGGGASGGW